MSPEDKDYFLERAEIELDLGGEAEHPRAAWAHFQLAGRYLDLAHRGPANEEGWEEDRRLPAQRNSPPQGSAGMTLDTA